MPSFSKYSTNTSFNNVPFESLKLVRNIKHKSKSLENNNKVLDLLDCSEHGINFIIGEENNYRELKNASLVSSRYHIDNKFGVMGILGPTRMDYSLISSQLQYVSSLIEINASNNMIIPYLASKLPE